MSRPITVAIVPSAGVGKRLGAKTKKPFVMVGGRPLVWYALRTLQRSPAIDRIIIAAEKGCVGRFEALVKRSGCTKVDTIVAGGATRALSVWNALAAVGPSADIVLIHDAARPFLTEEHIRASIAGAVRHGGCIIAVPESDTVKRVDARRAVRATLDRTTLYRAQTPQAFRYALFMRAYRSVMQRAKGVCGITDDASILEAVGKRVQIAIGSYGNIKVTTRDDMRYAEWLLGKRSAQNSNRKC